MLQHFILHQHTTVPPVTIIKASHNKNTINTLIYVFDYIFPIRHPDNDHRSHRNVLVKNNVCRTLEICICWFTMQVQHSLMQS